MSEDVKEVHVPAQEEQPERIRLDDVVLKRELLTAEAMLRSVVANNTHHDFIGHVDAARLLISNIIAACPRPAPEEAAQEPAEDSEE